LRLLLDTHIAVWLAIKRERLSKAEFGQLANPDNQLAVSAASIWEARIKWSQFFRSGARKGPVDPGEMLDLVQALGIAVEPLSAEICASTLSTPLAHKDPFDDLLLTIAQETGRKLFTRDVKLRGHPQAFHAD
jgi:PIN domain nuclease of toxin-antitoxin system